MLLEIYILQSIKSRRPRALRLAYKAMRSNKTKVDAVFGVSDWRVLIQCVHFFNLFSVFPLIVVIVIPFTIPMAVPWQKVGKKATTGQPGPST